MCTKAVCVCDTRGAGVSLHACQVIIPSDTTAEREKQEHSARKSQSLSQRRISSHSVRQMNPVTTESEFEVSRRESWRSTTYEVNTRVRTLPTFFFLMIPGLQTLFSWVQNISVSWQKEFESVCVKTTSQTDRNLLFYAQDHLLLNITAFVYSWDDTADVDNQ